MDTLAKMRLVQTQRDKRHTREARVEPFVPYEKTSKQRVPASKDRAPAGEVAEKCWCPGCGQEVYAYWDTAAQCIVVGHHRGRRFERCRRFMRRFVSLGNSTWETRKEARRLYLAIDWKDAPR